MQAPSAQVNTHSDMRIIVVDDAVVVRGLVSRWVEAEAGMSCVGSYRGVRQALDNFDRVKPDVIVLDVEMPEIDGLQAIPMFLEKDRNIVIIMASTLTKRNAQISLSALQKGAKDYIAKPDSNSGISTSDSFRQDLLAKIKAFARGGESDDRAVVVTHSALRTYSRTVPRILAIGSSTGGPQAVQSVMGALATKAQSFPVIIAQHMPKTFTNIFAEQIAKKMPGIVVKEGETGDKVEKGRVYIAPGGMHMVVKQDGSGVSIDLIDTPPVHFCKPAVDPMFDSVARVFGAGALGVVLTGMGQDGAEGALKIADAGGSVIAQDKASSVVWGMPGATVKLGAPAGVLALDDIPNKVLELFRV